MAIFNPDASATDRRYDPGEAVHEAHVFNLFLPTTPEPETGYPVVLTSSFGGFTSGVTPETTSPQLDQVTVAQQLLHDLLVAGVAVAHFVFPPPRSDAIAALPGKDDTGSVDPNAGEFGAPYGAGAGALVPHAGEVGDDWPGANPPSYVGTQPWSDPSFVLPSKAACYAIQHIKRHSVQGTGELKVNREKMILHGDGDASTVWSFPFYMPDLADRLGTHEQDSFSTRVPVAFLSKCRAYYPMFVADGLPSADFTAHQLARADSAPGYDEPSSVLNQSGLSQASEQAASPAFFGTTQGEPWGADASANDELYAYLFYDEGTLVDLGAANRWVFPYEAAVEQAAAPSSQGYVMKALWPDRTRLVIGDAGAIDNDAASTGGGADHDALITDADAQLTDAKTWILNQIGASLPIEEAVIEGVVATLYTITKANGYATEVAQIYRANLMPQDARIQSPFVLTEVLETGYRDDTSNTSRNNITFNVTLGMKGRTTMDVPLALFVADLRKAIQTNFLSSSGGEGPLANLSIKRAMVTRSRKLMQSHPTLGEVATVVATLQVDYDDKIDDPYVGNYAPSS